MGFSFNYRLILQFVCILAGVFGIIASCINMFRKGTTFVSIIRGVYAIFFCVILILVEVFLFAFFKYFGFLMKMGGKALMYLFVGALLFGRSGFPLVCAIIFWALALAFGIMAFLLPQIAPPILQGGLKPGAVPDLTVSSEGIYEGEGKNAAQSNNTGGDASYGTLNQDFTQAME